jgi:MFS family permease
VSVASLLPRLPRLAWIYLLTRISPAIGSGLALPFVLVYLHNARGISLPAAGGIWGARVIVMIIGSFFAGRLIDRYGPVGISVVGLLITASGWIILGFATNVQVAVISSIVAGVGGGVSMPTNGALVARFITPDIRHSVFSLQFGIFNLGIAFGAAIAGFIATSTHPSTYTLLFILTAACSIPTIIFNLYLGATTRQTEKNDLGNQEKSPTPGGGYMDLLRIPLLRRLVISSLVYFLAGEAIWSVGIAPYMKNFAGFPESRIGIIFTVNTITVFIFQFIFTKLIEGRERLKVLACGHIVWGLAFMTVIAATHFTHGDHLFFSLILITCVIALAECTAPPVVQPLVIDSAPSHLQGRALALISKGQSVGMASGSVVVGFLLAGHANLLWMGSAVALIAMGGVLFLTQVPMENRFIPSSKK